MKASKELAVAPLGDEPSTSGQGVPSRVMYIGRLPHGFYEDQLKGYFEQFGVVSRVRLSRCKKTGKSKHYAFLEFATPEVASIVAEAMNNYMMMGQKLQCRVMDKEEVHPELWRGANRRFRRIPWAKIEAKRHNKERTPEEEATRLKRALSRDRKRLQRLQRTGIEYEYVALEELQSQQQQQLEAPAPLAKTAAKTAKKKRPAEAPAVAVRGAATAAPAAAAPAKPGKRAKTATAAAAAAAAPAKLGKQANTSTASAAAPAAAAAAAKPKKAASVSKPKAPEVAAAPAAGGKAAKAGGGGKAGGKVAARAAAPAARAAAPAAAKSKAKPGVKEPKRALHQGAEEAALAKTKKAKKAKQVPAVCNTGCC